MSDNDTETILNKTLYRNYVDAKLSHLKKGEHVGPPADRVPDENDEVVASIIEALPSATRMFPDLYSWIIVDALRAELVCGHYNRQVIQKMTSALESADSGTLSQAQTTDSLAECLAALVKTTELLEFMDKQFQSLKQSGAKRDCELVSLKNELASGN